MAKAESFDDLLFHLGDLARERLAGKPGAPRGMDRVLKAERALIQRRDELQALEDQMNEEDASYRDFLDRHEEERGEQQALVRKWKRNLEGVEARVKDLRKRLDGKRQAYAYEQESLQAAEHKHRELEAKHGSGHPLVMDSAEDLKRLRLAQLKRDREAKELEEQLELVLTPRPGQIGAQGLLALKRLLEMERESEERKARFEQTMADLDEAIATKEEEVTAAEDFLDQALFILGEECYAQRVADPALSALYPRLDRAR